MFLAAIHVITFFISENSKSFYTMSTPTSAFNAMLDDIGIEIQDDISALCSTLADPSDAEPAPPVHDVDDLLASVGPDKRKKIRSGLLTIHPPSSHPSWLKPETWFPQCDDILEIWCAKFEKGEDTGNLHVHIYFKLKHSNTIRFELLQKWITKHVTGFDFKPQRSATKNSTQCVVNYVLKPETSVGDPFIWNASCAFDQKTWDARHKGKGKKQEIIDHIMARDWTLSWASLVHESDESRALLADCGWGKRFQEDRAAAQPRRKIKDVVILYGAAGTGKTTMAMDWDSKPDETTKARYYRRSCDEDFWGGGATAYNGQRVIHYDEFGGQEKFASLKEITSIGLPGPPVKVKGSGRDLNHDTVVFTSNVHPAGWYKGVWAKDPHQFKPFQRRVTKVLFFPRERPDGTENVPSDGNPAHFVDQTPEWVAFGDNLDLAIEHAESCWPLPATIEDDGGGAFAPGFSLTSEPEPKRRRFF
ncbi:replication associated protein [Avon-Heathcote estuary associated bacilladnavirus]|uniref:Replication-associated protein n=1 Tax=Avon-Heathcote Estuary associated kieseladnavirus TaxID=3052270 RepID=REP_AHEBV|nr:replication associated protein [Avon-Heathcote estuary associated bacilladnavirus]A0A1P8YT89.1 RecName: Full=Replication-associated protein; Short=Rep [Kieseladnavirus ampcren]AQA27298.1 replication associated protein [Avon-Heathcote estuary associated bacilladnavirus]